MDIIPLKRLFLVAGFEGQDLGARVTRLQRHFEGGDHKFVARVYPSNADKRPDYLRKLVKDANNLIFGSDGATNFCRKQDQLCAVAPKEGKGVAKLCERKHVAKAACGRARPQLIVVLCATRIYDEAFERLGRATLIRMAEPLTGVNAFREEPSGLTPCAVAHCPIALHRPETAGNASIHLRYQIRSGQWTTRICWDCCTNR